MTSAFAKYESQNYPHRYHIELAIDLMAGGVPMDANVYEGHLKRKLAGGVTHAVIADEVMALIAENGLTPDQAIAEFAGKSLVGFRRDPEHGLWYPGAHLKAALKEGASIAAAEGRIKAKGWGKTSHNKGILSWLSEHVFVVEDRLYLGSDRGDANVRVEQSFVHKMTPKGPISAVQNTEIVEDVTIRATIETDHLFAEEDWAAIWLSCERNGIGAARKMGYGTFEVSEWRSVRRDAVVA